jgi:hypothetical protein
MLVTVFAKKGKNCAPAVNTADALRIIPAERYLQALLINQIINP